VVSCNVCGWSGDSFEPLFDFGNVYCKSCGSYERHRALTQYLDHIGLPPSERVLEVGAGAISALRLFFRYRRSEYHSLDLWHGNGSTCGDASELPFRDDSFDLVVCMHVLEHVHEEKQAISELARVTRRGGTTIVQVPYDDTTFETGEYDIHNPNNLARPYHYHHKREYGLDIVERLGAFFESVIEVNPVASLRESDLQFYGCDRNFGTLFFCGAKRDYPGSLVRDLLPLKRSWLTRRRAHQLFLAGSADTLGNWLQAESEIAPMSDCRLSRWNVYDILTGVRAGEDNGADD